MSEDEGRTTKSTKEDTKGTKKTGEGVYRQVAKGAKREKVS